MTWYRCGGSGLPAGLQSDMDTVFNKKFSTSTTYPPTDWPDTVNLMGPLPEKTASGAIANITDGADGVPLKNWLVTLPASLDGYTEVNGYKANTNFYDDKHLNVGLPATAIGSSIDTINTTATRYTYNGFSSPRSNIAIKGSRNDTSVVGACLFFGYSGGFLTEYRSINPFGSSAVVIDCSGFDYVRISIGAASGYQAPTDMTAYGYVSAEYGTTFTEYVPADTEQYTAQLGRTIYGGAADIVTGEGEDENGNAFTFTPITPTPETALGVNNFWADEGDSDVTYRADISLALQALGGGGRGLMMMRPTEPEETEETEETEGLEDELNR